MCDGIIFRCNIYIAMKKSHFVAIRNQASDNTLELYFLDIIQDSYDWYSGMQTSKVQEIIDKVNYYQPSKIICYIDSIGGDAQCGMSIYNFLKLTTAKVECRVIGLAASVASVIAMAANKGKLLVARNGFVMIHQAQGMAWGTANDLRQAADLVDKYTDQIIDIYTQRTGKTADEIKGLINGGDYWMTGQEAVDQGFADDTFNEVETINVNVAARLEPDQIERIPVRIRAQMEHTKDDSIINKIESEMKKLGDVIKNLFASHKPAKPEDTAILNQVGDIMKPALDEFSTEVDTAITNGVNESIASKPVNDAIATQVANAVNGIDFSVDGAPKTSLDLSVTNCIKNSLKAEGDNDIKTFIKNLVDAATADLKTKNADLEREIVAIKGKPLNAGNGGAEGQYQARGKKTGS